MGKCALCAKNDANPFSRICYSGGMNISICNAARQRYAAAVVQQPYRVGCRAVILGLPQD